MVNQQCRESNGKAKITGIQQYQMSQAHHSLSTEIVTGLGHHAIRECWSTGDQAAGDEEDGVQVKVGDQLGSNWVSHQSSSGKEHKDNKEDAEEEEGELENKSMEGAGQLL